MMIKANGEYLDFDGDITLERQIKLFEEIATSNGDFSYAFEVQKTINNTRILAAPFPDNISKLVYHKVPAEIISNDGVPLYKGYMRIEGIGQVYKCSFFSGNNNWFSLLSGSMKQLDFSEFEKDIDIDVIRDSWNETEGVKYPLIDSGNLSSRSENVFQLIDFIPFMFVSTAMKKIFNSVGIKLQGDLLDEATYKKMMFATNPTDQTALDARSTYAQKDFQGPVPDPQFKLTFPNDSVLPFFDGVQNNFNAATSTYTADTTMMVNVEFVLNFDDDVLGIWYIRINGVDTTDGSLDGAGIFDQDKPLQVVKNNILLQQGDTLEIALGAILVTGNITSGYLKVTPTIVYKVTAGQLVPNWTKQEFVANVLRCFNVIASYEPPTQTLTLDLFDKIKSKDPIDLSGFISSTEVDYVEFISAYAKRNILGYSQMTGFREIDDYNDRNEIPYGSGIISADNDFLEPEKEIIKLDFTAPYDYYNGTFDLPLARVNINQVQEGPNTISVTQVNDNGGDAEFVLGNGHGLIVGDLVKVSKSNIVSYNGEHIVSALISTDKVKLYNVPYDDDANLDFVKMIPSRTNNDSVFVALDTGGLPDDESFYTGKTEIVIALPGIIYETDAPSLAFFNMPFVGRQINEVFKISLSFGPVNLPDRYQQSMKESYYRLFDRVLNDPVKLKSLACIPYDKFLSMDFLHPVQIKTLETSNLYYLNRQTDYQAPYIESTLELIKI